MIWIGRLLSVPAGVVFFALLLLTLVMLEINDTFLDPDFYTEELRKANTYEFALGVLLTSALDEAREQDLPEGLDENPLVSSGLTTQDIVASINRAVPPEWVQGLVEQSFDQVGKYLTGERDQFVVTFRARDQVVTMVDEVKSLLRKADAYSLLYDQQVIPRIEDAEALELPLGLDITSDRMVEAARAVVPPDWVQGQVEGILDEVTPYFVGERDTFKINIQLAVRVEIALQEIKKLLRESDAYELLYSEVVEPELSRRLGGGVELPLGVTITEDEVLASLRQVAPQEWVQEQAERVIDDASPYLTGKVEGFVTEVSLVENKRLAEGVIAELVDRKTMEIVEGLPSCASVEEARDALVGQRDGLPPCIPSNIPLDQLLGRLEIDIAGQVQGFILAPIPDTIRFDESQLRSALSLAGAGENLDQMDTVREILRDGWTYTQDDLRRDLITHGDADALETLDDVRAFLADGWTYTEADFREDIVSGADEAALRNLDTARDTLKAARTYKWVVYLPLVVLLVIIGFMGGRTWGGRVAWASAFLLITAGLVFVAFGPIYEALASAGLDEARDAALTEIDESVARGELDFPETARLAANKAFDVVESVADGFASGIAQSGLNLAIIGLVAMIAAIFWSAIMGLVDRILPGRRE
jgi:hypothetical protein